MQILVGLHKPKSTLWFDKKHKCYVCVLGCKKNLSELSRCWGNSNITFLGSVESVATTIARCVGLKQVMHLATVAKVGYCRTCKVNDGKGDSPFSHIKGFVNVNVNVP